MDTAGKDGAIRNVMSGVKLLDGCVFIAYLLLKIGYLSRQLPARGVLIFQRVYLALQLADSRILLRSRFRLAGAGHKNGNTADSKNRSSNLHNIPPRDFCI
jgi:hypothetical protein